MEKNGLRVPGTLKHSSEARAEADLQKEARTHVAAQPGIRFLADTLAALHAAPQPIRSSRGFYSSFPPRQVLQALAERAELRVRLVRAITGGAPTLLRRLAPADLAAQVELLVAEDLPPAERALRAEEDRALPVLDLYLKYLDPADLAVYLPVSTIWEYESYDGWWTRDAGPGGRALMSAELKSIRRHGILSDSEFLDVLGDETIERDLPLGVRTSLRAAARKAAREGKAFKDSDLFASVRSADGARDLTDELADHIPLTMLRKVVARAADLLGFAKEEAAGATRPDTPVPTRPLTIQPSGAATAAARGIAPPPKGGKLLPAPPRGRIDTPMPDRARTQPVALTAAESASPFADEEAIGPDQVVTIEEIPG